MAKKLLTIQLKPGLVVAENVLSFDRQVIVAKGSVLTDSVITRLDMHGILQVLVDDEIVSDAQNEVAEKDAAESANKSYSERIRNSAQFKKFKASFEANTEHLKFALNDMVYKNIKIPAKMLMARPLEVAMQADNRSDILEMIHNMRDYDDSTYAHSMNVALLNYVAAGWMKWSREDQEEAMLCGLLHDIGKLQIDHKIISKPGKLTDAEYSQIKKHPILGYKILQGQDVSEHVLYSALMHHERYDGTGYPMQLHGSQIDKFALLTSVTDVYDAMTSSRCYRGALCPFRVIEMFEEEGFSHYEVEYVLSFLSNVADTYIQSQCKLSDDRIGSIVMINKEKLSKPVVLCESAYVDLLQNKELRIASLL